MNKKIIKKSYDILKKSTEENKKYKTKILGKTFVIYPNVFSPKYFKDAEFFSKEIPINKKEDFLEIGSGTGIISIFAAKRGARKVIATDINPFAIKNTKENVKLHKLESKIEIRKGNIFHPLKKDERFDTIFWNTPFIYTRKKSKNILLQSIEDPKYKLKKEFLKKAKNYLNPNGRILLGFSPTVGNVQKLKKIIEKNKFKVKTIKKSNKTKELSLILEILEIRPITC